MTTKSFAIVLLINFLLVVQVFRVILKMNKLSRLVEKLSLAALQSSLVGEAVLDEKSLFSSDFTG